MGRFCIAALCDPLFGIWGTLNLLRNDILDRGQPSDGEGRQLSDRKSSNEGDPSIAGREHVYSGDVARRSKDRSRPTCENDGLVLVRECFGDELEGGRSSVDGRGIACERNAVE